MEKKLEEKLLYELEHHSFRKYSENYFKQYFATPEEIGRSKRKRVVNAKIVNIYSTYKKRLLCRSFYIEEGFENKEFYRYIYEVKRQLAGLKQMVTNRVYASSFGGILILTGNWYRNYFTYTVNVNGNEMLWEKNNVDSYIFYDNIKYKVAEHNDYRHFLDSSIHKYCAFEFTDYRVEELFKYLKKYDDHPKQIEMLAKMGLQHLIRNTAGLRFTKPMPQFLGIDKNDIEYLRHLKLPLTEFRKNLEWIRKYKIKHMHEYILYKTLIECNINPTQKLFDYLNRQCETIKENLYGATGRYVSYSISNVINLYTDYIKMGREIAMIMNSSNRYPADLKKAHDELNKNIYVLRNEKKDKKILSNSRKYDKYIYFNDNYLICPCRNSGELIEESNVLNHCVKQYIDRVCENQTEIFFIRKKEEPNRPYVTLELKQKEIKQCYGKNDYIPDDHVKEFVKEWANKNKLKLNIWRCGNG